MNFTNHHIKECISPDKASIFIYQTLNLLIPFTMKPIGGYIELQLPVGEEYYPSLIKLNTGRNSLEYILLVKGYRTIYLPYFTCDVLLEPIKHLGIKLKYYHIDSNLDPIIDFELGPTDCIVYTNYFGLKQDTVNRLSTYIDNLIIDNSQAFFPSHCLM